ncbi:transglutaminase-like domain-containing protein [Microbacterium elymi]|uniref:Transglutaminase-like domain-containing protein n=1 Tax=Microbacterium elymi TaxID=2909587 RepID=A0ABY5NMZ4_9MICO|nr:transglutaminase-like domain-containing protein [Microbacterium elymi]UUT36540.1 transglutaminase-like domain-containing protein [Microbacterium elymi]
MCSSPVPRGTRWPASTPCSGQLLARQADTDSASLVAATGDDEQFSVAVALIAEELGFPARVVVGARLSGPDTGVPLCAEGVCTGGTITAWTEVRSASGQWVPIDITRSTPRAHRTPSPASAIPRTPPTCGRRRRSRSIRPTRRDRNRTTPPRRATTSRDWPPSGRRCASPGSPHSDCCW